jgi:hypothetical protein
MELRGALARAALRDGANLMEQAKSQRVAAALLLRGSTSARQRDPLYPLRTSPRFFAGVAGKRSRARKRSCAILRDGRRGRTARRDRPPRTTKPRAVNTARPLRPAVGWPAARSGSSPTRRGRPVSVVSTACRKPDRAGLRRASSSAGPEAPHRGARAARHRRRARPTVARRAPARPRQRSGAAARGGCRRPTHTAHHPWPRRALPTAQGRRESPGDPHERTSKRLLETSPAPAYELRVCLRARERPRNAPRPRATRADWPPAALLVRGPNSMLLGVHQREIRAHTWSRGW